MAKRILDPKETPTKDLHQFIIGGVAPRPIAFVSTVDESGRENLAPYSFFNAFSSNPPILVFSSNRKVKDNTTKDTLYNVQKTKEAVINVVNYDIVRQMALTSVEFPRGESEFLHTGLTPLPAKYVKAPLVKESPMNMECKVKEIITLGDQGGAGHLIICEVQAIHIDENVIDGNRINPHKIDLMGRLGRMNYVRASGDAIMEIVQLVSAKPIGYQALPEHVKNSTVLSANHITRLAAAEEIPNADEASSYVKKLATGISTDQLHQLIMEKLDAGEIESAMKLTFGSLN